MSSRATQTVMTEALIVGGAFAITTSIVFMLASDTDQKELIGKVFATSFVGGFSLHLLSEYTGINEVYVKNFNKKS